MEDSIRVRLTELGCSFKENKSFAEIGYWKIGGILRWLVDVHTIEQLLGVLSLEVPYLILGNGSNMLLSDQGFNGISIRLDGAFKQLEWTENGLLVGAGMSNSKVLRSLKKVRRAGLGSLAGVPGTIGGALRMNAGTYLGEIGDVVDWVEWCDQGVVHRTNASDMKFEYRRVALPWSAIILRAHLLTNTYNVDEELDSIQHHLARRKATQPLHQPSCGSVFKNPTGDYAGRLIEMVGLKGHQIGQAQISEKHANFIVNKEGATANDVASLIRLARETVYSETGITLEPEVRREGVWKDTVWALEHEQRVSVSGSEMLDALGFTVGIQTIEHPKPKLDNSFEK